MNANMKPTELVMAVMENGGVIQFPFDSVVKARKFQQSITGTINRMLKAKSYEGYWLYLNRLRVVKDKRDVYIGPTEKMPLIYGNVKGKQIVD